MLLLIVLVLLLLLFGFGGFAAHLLWWLFLASLIALISRPFPAVSGEMPLSRAQ